MTNSEILAMHRALTAVDYDEVRDGRFQFNLLKNIDKAEREQKAIEKARLKLRSKPLAAFLDNHQEGIQKAIQSFVEGKQEEQRRRQTQLYITNDEVEQAQLNYLQKQEGWNDVSADYEKFNQAVERFMKTENKDFKPHLFEVSYVESLPLNQTQMRPIFSYLTELE